MFAVLVTPVLTLLAATVAYVRADPNPTSPGPGDVFIQGQPCTISWDADTTGIWKAMDIQLMTGNNVDMTFLSTVATVDGTDPSKNTFSYTCPEVTPHSPIYFYQFTTTASANKTWTGRFTITDSVNDIVAPTQSTQPDGENIPWGTGSLVNGSSTVPAASGASVATPPDSSTSAITPGSPLLSASTTSTSDAGYLTTYAKPSTVSTAETNGTVGMLFVSHVLFQTVLALALAAFGFTVMF